MIGADSGQNAIIVMPRANLALTPALVTNAIQDILARHEISDTGVFMAQNEMRAETITAGLRAARKAGLITIFNAAPAPREPFPPGFFELIDILIVNESEASAIGSLTVDTPEMAQQTAAHLLEMGTQHVVITLGAQGALWSHRISGAHAQLTHYWQHALPAAQVDATAAGDAFCGALAASLANGMSMKDALRIAGAAGAITVTRLGAFPSLPTANEVVTLLKNKIPPV